MVCVQFVICKIKLLPLVYGNGFAVTDLVTHSLIFHDTAYNTFCDTPNDTFYDIL